MDGSDPWYTEENDYFPCKVDQREITVEYDVSLDSNGEHNLSFDLWINSSPVSTTDNITHEIMIWMVNKGMTPGGKQKDKIEIDGILYTVFVWENVSLGQPDGERTYIAFVAEENHLSEKIIIDHFPDYLLDNHYLNDSLYISGIEFGTEIVDGSGEILFHEYGITVK